jgi:hypothetical protein
VSAEDCLSAKNKLDNHLGDTVTTQSLASNESLALDSSQCVEGGCDEENNGSDDETGRLDGDRDPLDDTHGKVDGGAHVIGLESADEGVKRGRCRADAQEERDFDKEDDKRADTECWVSTVYLQACDSYSQAYHGEQDDPVEEEDVANAETEAQHHADDTGPVTWVSECDCRASCVVDPTIDRIYLFASQRVV